MATEAYLHPRTVAKRSVPVYTFVFIPTCLFVKRSFLPGFARHPAIVFEDQGSSAAFCGAVARWTWPNGIRTLPRRAAILATTDASTYRLPRGTRIDQSALADLADHRGCSSCNATRSCKCRGNDYKGYVRTRNIRKLWKLGDSSRRNNVSGFVLFQLKGVSF